MLTRAFILLIAATVASSASGADDASQRRILLLYAVDITVPQQLGVTVGAAVAIPGTTFVSERHGPVGSGFLAELEMATAGGKVGAGWHIAGGMVSASGALVVLRTWANPWGVPPDQTFLGVQASVKFAIIRVRVGHLWRGGSGGEQQLVLGLGVGF
jgi:hypothetical protein